MVSGVTGVTEVDGAKVRVPKAAELVAGTIRRQIVLGELPQGALLPPGAALMAQFGISRPTLREAFRILESELLITVRRGARGGAWVKAPSGEVAARYAGTLLQFRGTTLEDVHRCRIMIEPPAVAIVAEQHEAEGIARLQDILDDNRDIKPHSHLVDEFHRTLIGLAGNQTLTVLAGMVEEIIQMHSARYAATQPKGLSRYMKRAHADHQKVLELIKAGTASEAEALWKQHLTGVSQVMLKDTRSTTVLDLVT